MTSTTIIERLNKYEFHDMVIESISFYNDDNQTQLIVKALPYNDNKNQYENMELIFSDIIKLRTNEIVLDKTCELAFDSFDYEYNGWFNCRLTFELGFAKSLIEINLQCNEIVLNK